MRICKQKQELYIIGARMRSIQVGHWQRVLGDEEIEVQ